jgi:hypothetical protein
MQIGQGSNVRRQRINGARYEPALLNIFAHIFCNLSIRFRDAFVIRLFLVDKPDAFALGQHFNERLVLTNALACQF